MSNLPKGWSLEIFENISTLQRGTSFTKANLIEGIIPVIAGGKEPAYYHNDYNREGETITISGSGANAGFVNYFDTKIFVSDGFTVKGINDISLTKYLFYFLKWKQDYIYFLQSGGAQPHVYLKDIAPLNISFPPLQEQKKIADILSTVDKKIAFVEENINATEELKKGLMQKLLTEGIGHTEFKDSELGRIPESWEVVKLEEVCTKIVGGGTPSKNEPDYWNNGTIPWVTPSEFTKSKSNYISVTENKISEEGLKNSSATLLASGTVIMSSRATIGECKINTIEITTNQGFISFQCNDLLNNLYLLYLIKQNKPNILKVSSGSTFLEVSRTSMKNFSIAIPSLEEQKQIAEILSTVDNKLENLKEKKQSFEELKKGLMQKLLTGEVRV